MLISRVLSLLFLVVAVMFLATTACFWPNMTGQTRFTLIMIAAIAGVLAFLFGNLANAFAEDDLRLKRAQQRVAADAVPSTSFAGLYPQDEQPLTPAQEGLQAEFQSQEDDYQRSGYRQPLRSGQGLPSRVMGG